ncbi:MAG: ATP-binding cassette domain-containing protein [Burkholderiales bacterium]|nr:ATP-binding cassette domain-containing protein [Burkholderiales bacterium]
MIKVENLVKNFGPKIAVNDVSFNVERGEVLGFLGPNGAGKSTTMRMVTGFIPPTAGRISVGGYDMLANPIPAKRLIGYLPENAPSYADMTVHGFLNFAAEMRAIDGDARKRAVNRAVEMCMLENVLYQTIDTLSKGYRHRTCLAQSIIHDPDILVMDEPTDGLDPNQKHEVRNLIKRMGANKAIIFSTHILEEVDAACSRVIIIDRGKIVANGTPDELRRRSHRAGAVAVVVSGVSAAQLSEALAAIDLVAKVETLSETPAQAIVRAHPQTPEQKPALVRAVLDLIAQQQWRIEDLRTEEGHFDEVFRSITLPDTMKEARP